MKDEGKTKYISKVEKFIDLTDIQRCCDFWCET